MHVAILTFEGFNELDSLIALGILNRVKRPAWRVSLACPTPQVRSMNGVVIEAQASLADARSAIMEQLRFDTSRQLLAAQCSGALLLAKLNLLRGVPACTDLTSKPWVEEAGVTVLNQSFYAEGNVATAGGCLASQYLAAWVIARLVGVDEAEKAIHYVAPVGEKQLYVERALGHIQGRLRAA